MLIPYPNDFPAFALSIIVDKLRNKPVDLNTAVHAAWVVSGWALNNVLPDSPIIGNPVLNNPEAEAELIEKLLVENQQQAVTGIIPYAILAEIAMNILIKFLMGRKS